MLLIFTSQSGKGRVVDIDHARLTIGRVEDNDVQLSDEKVSRHHAVIELAADGRVVLRDLDSRNGTFVDGVRLSGSRVLSGGESLRFGDQEVRVDRGASAGAADGALARGAAPERAAGRSERARRALAPLATRRGVLLLVFLLALVLVFGVGQLVLPGVAEDRLRAKLEQYGPVRRVHISSTPAIQLLWHRADRVEVAMDSYTAKAGGQRTSLADFLSKTRDATKLDVNVGVLHSQVLTLHEVRLHKEGDFLVGHAELSQQELSAALPGFLDLRPVSASQEGIVVQVSASVLGQRLTVHARLLAERGHVLVRPEGIPFGSLASVSVFDDPRVYVESLGAELRGEQYFLTARARLK
jgi:pSer/pThr/pTyr-binding forkhead associated (FHA) protein